MHPEPHSVEKRGGDAHAPNMSISQNVPSSLLPIRDRVITFCHIGKAGGMTLRRATSLTCRLAKQQNDTPLKVQQCINRTFQPNHVLARSTQYYFHMWDVNTIELANSTSFLMALRNPVDRAISSFKFSHPGNCKREQDYDIAKRPWGCQVKMYMKKPDEVQRWMYQVCFPSAGMEEFAQNVLGPYPKNNPSHHFVHSNMTHEVQQQCRWIARQHLRGQWRQGAGPHMLYNYEYYRNTTIGKFPDKEVLGVRMEHEWEDIKALDVAMGGSGEYRHREGIHERHGSETFEASPLTTEAYHKLCCVLEREIGVYRDILDLVVNLNATAKQETLDDVQQKCGIETSWEDWGRNCRERMATDQAGLDESVNQRGIPMK
ncbi:expressed unknown protein [Seminavis robusta]|uniref:Uncharacterized protein n=1 Tax=Seminavis robusta TaxID=568900 RepID=A0A9N8E4Q9_9STRA|nr:expressed unknown protein [Seminavis robusta]|eukprot:Sro666_g183940.1 n/a (374) ;mRNA; f:12847-13968